MASPPSSTSTPRTRRPAADVAKPSAKTSAKPGAKRPKAAAQALLAAPPEPVLLEGPTREDRIRRRAYEIYERSGGIEGRDIDHWLAAEAEIDAEVLEGTAPAEHEGDAPPLV
jgi:hypothetical protein